MSISEHRSKQFSGQIDLNQIRRILILRMGPLGETLLTTPVIRALRRRFPEAYIAYMVAPGTRRPRFRQSESERGNYLQRVDSQTDLRDGEKVIPDGGHPPTDVSPCIAHIPCTHPVSDRL